MDVDPELQASQVQDGEGPTTEILVIELDTTRGTRAEGAERESQRVLQQAMQVANVGLWDVDLLSSRVRYSHEWKQQLGYEDNEIGDSLEEWASRLHPDDGVRAHDLALAYLVMPMSSEGDRIRVGVAVNALRAALRVYTPDTHPTAWASTQLNLANALQYLPSVHQESNLDEAVQLYEEVLAYRDPATDPVGYARILANQGNALGHLGVFADARERLERARTLFAGAGDADGVDGVDEVLASLAEAEQTAEQAAVSGVADGVR